MPSVAAMATSTGIVQQHITSLGDANETGVVTTSSIWIGIPNQRDSPSAAERNASATILETSGWR